MQSLKASIKPRLEERLLEASADKPRIWMRFIDNVFFEKLKSFINHLNSSHENIKFTSEQSRDRIRFLDVQVRVGGRGSPYDKLVLQAN